MIPESTEPPLARWQWLAGALLLALVAYAAYWPSLTGGFLWDDDIMLTNNHLIKAADGLSRFWFTTEAVDYWPVTNSSLWLEWRVWGMNPTGYHVTNVLLHVVNAILFWRILRRLAIPGGLLAALLFVVHPVNVESVAWITQRKNTLSLFFFLLSTLWYLRYDVGLVTRGRPTDDPRRHGAIGWYGLSLCAFIFAVLSKASAVTLPLSLLLIVWWKRDRIAWIDLARSIPFFAVGGGLTLVNLWFRTHGIQEVVRHASIVERVVGAAAIVWFYLGKALVPINLSFVYPLWNIQVGDVRWWLPLAAALALTAVLVWKRHSPAGRAGLFAWSFFCLMLLPVLGFADTFYMRYSLVADHYQYTAILGVVGLVAAGASQLVRRVVPG